jgi:REP element-mobilizing transposase RayT
LSVAKPIALTYCSSGDELSAKLHLRRQLFLHGQSGRASLRLLVDYVDLLRDAFRHVRRRHPFNIEAIVVLPDHLHAIWTLPEGDADFALQWRLIKSMFSQGLPAGERRSASRAKKAERGVWQRRYWEHTLRDYAQPILRAARQPVHRWISSYRSSARGRGEIEGCVKRCCVVQHTGPPLS